jgi:hypothetical protein
VGRVGDPEMTPATACDTVRPILTATLTSVLRRPARWRASASNAPVGVAEAGSAAASARLGRDCDSIG